MYFIELHEHLLPPRLTQTLSIMNLQLRNQPNPHATNCLLIIPQWTKLKESVSVAAHKSTALMRQVDKLVKAKAMDEIVHDDCRVAVLGLAHDIHGSGVIQVEVMHQAAPPRRYSVRAAETDIANEGVAATVKVSGVVVASESILLGPVNLKVRKVGIVPLSQNSNLVRINMHLS